MKVAVFRPRWARNNTAFEVQARLFAYLQKHNDVEITVFADAENRFRYPGLNVTDVQRMDDSWISGVKARLMRLPAPDYPDWQMLKGYDVIETSDPTLHEYSYTAHKAAEAWGSRLVCGSSVTLPGLFKTSFRRARRVMDAAFKISCCTRKAEERFIEQGLIERNDPRIVIMGHPVDVEMFEPASGREESCSTRIISVGRLDEAKGHDIVLKAFADLRRAGHEVEWLIVGRGPAETSLRNAVARLGVENVVRFLGSLPNDRLPDYYRHADIFALHQRSTSKWEEFFGVAMIEAMSCGLPVVATNTGGIPCVVQHGVTGYLTNQEDLSQVTSSLQKLVSDERQRKEMGASGRKHVLEKFAMNVVAGRCLALWGYS